MSLLSEDAGPLRGNLQFEAYEPLKWRGCTNRPLDSTSSLHRTMHLLLYLPSIHVSPLIILDRTLEPLKPPGASVDEALDDSCLQQPSRVSRQRHALKPFAPPPRLGVLHLCSRHCTFPHLPSNC